MSDETLIDARGLRCPWPVLRLARAMRDQVSPVRILADDPIAPAEIRGLAAERGWSCTEIAADGHFAFTIAAPQA